MSSLTILPVTMSSSISDQLQKDWTASFPPSPPMKEVTFLRTIIVQCIIFGAQKLFNKKYLKSEKNDAFVVSRPASF